MDAKFQIVNANKIDATMTITMPLGEWRALREQVKNEWPGCNVAYAINTLVIQIEKVYWPEDKP